MVKDTDLRRKSVKIWLTESEHERLQSLKARPELARWIREVALSGEGSKKHVVKHILPPEIVRVISGVGSNLNQMAKAINGQIKMGELDLNKDTLSILMQLEATEQALNGLREYLKNDR